MGPPRRELGHTEGNWCLAVDGGTGNTISAFLFGLSLSKATVQASVNKLLCWEPFLRSRIIAVGQKLYFELSEETVPVEEVAIRPGLDSSGAETSGGEKEIWLKIFDSELNIQFPKSKPLCILQVHLYRGLPEESSLVVFRVHTSAADMLSTGTLAWKFLNALKEVVQEDKSGETSYIEEALLNASLDKDIFEKYEYYKSIEKAVPPGAADKPFWAHGTDTLGYGLVTRRHAYLPFSSTQQPRESHLIRASLSKEATDRLLESCEKNSTNLYGALLAAGLKSVAAFKKTGNKGEHYGVAVLYNCRPVLVPKLPEDALGFYHSALMKTHHAKESDEYWKLATTCSSDMQDSLKKGKHFRDMGNLNMLMVQAIHHTNLTPSSTLRTALFSILHDPVTETTTEEMTQVLQLKDFVSGSSTHGVGPCLGFFPFLRNGALHLSVLYCEPLFTQSDIQTLVDGMVGYLTV